MKIYHSLSSQETQRLGKEFGLLMARRDTKHIKKSQGATTVVLSGDLGSGKTTFVQGLFEGMGIKKRALSPTFIIMRRYALARKKFSNVFHMDAYRLNNHEQLAALGFEKIMSNPKNLLLIEWGEKVKPLIPKNAQWLQFSYGKKEGQRKITMK